MRLAASEIRREIRAGNLTFDPPVDSDLIKDSSVDLSLSETFYALEPVSDLERAGLASVIELYRYSWLNFIRQFGQEITIADDGYPDIPVQQLMPGYTRERVRLPQRLGGRVEGKSSNARIGLFVHISAPAVHPGFNSRIMLEFYNVGPLPIRVRPGDPICQLILEQVEGEGLYQGQFQT